MSYTYQRPTLCLLAMCIMLSGCTRNSEILCDSVITKQRISSDIERDFKDNLSSDYLSYLSDITLEDIVTTGANETAETRDCEATVAIATNIDDQTAYQTILYTNQTVASGKENSRTIYNWINTFGLLRSAFTQTVQIQYQKDKAKEAGFDSYQDMQRYESAKQSLEELESSMKRINHRISIVSEQLAEFDDGLDHIKTDFDNGKTVMLTNAILNMDAVEIKPNDRGFGAGNKLNFFTVNVENISPYTLKEFSMEADIVANEADRNTRADLEAKISFEEPIAPGDTTTVKVVLLDPPKNSFKHFGKQHYSDISWRDVKQIKMTLTPTMVLTGNGQQKPVTQKYAIYNSSGEPTRLERVLYYKYYDLTKSLNTLRRSKDNIQVKMNEAIADMESLSTKTNRNT